MERPQALLNFWLVVKTALWVAVLGGLFEFISIRSNTVLVRRILAHLLGRDPAEPAIDWGDIREVI